METYGPVQSIVYPAPLAKRNAPLFCPINKSKGFCMINKQRKRGFICLFNLSIWQVSDFCWRASPCSLECFPGTSRRCSEVWGFCTEAWGGCVPQKVSWRLLRHFSFSSNWRCVSEVSKMVVEVVPIAVETRVPPMQIWLSMDVNICGEFSNRSPIGTKSQLYLKLFFPSQMGPLLSSTAHGISSRLMKTPA